MRKFLGLLLLFSLPLFYGCACSLETVNKDAREAGESAGKVISLPTSVSEGAAEGVKGEDDPNPYNR